MKGDSMFSEGELERVCCPGCGAEAHTVELRGKDLLYCTGGDHTLVRCSGCGLVYLNPRPHAASIGEFYQKDYFQVLIGSAAVASRREKFLIRISLIKDTRLVDQLRRRIGLSSEWNVLDVGCGIGSFLIALKNRLGMCGAGIDTIPDVVRSLRETHGLEIVEGNFLDEGMGFEEGLYDLVTMWHFLEHVEDPVRCLAKTHRLLRAGGYLAIEVPNYGGLSSRIFGNNWLGLCLPTHLTHFEPPSLIHILEKNGYEVLALVHDVFPLFLLGSMQLMIGKRSYYRDVKKYFWQLFLLSLLEAPLSRLFAAVKRGDVLRVIARRI
jgi:ubiquinone/menaquinone biosynthesis C-methylase UbiE